MNAEPETELRLVFETLGGACPVQGSGTVNGRTFYFRARGDRWALHITDPDEPDWVYEEHYGKWPDAGYMTCDEAQSFIKKAARVWVAGEFGQRIND